MKFTRNELRTLVKNAIPFRQQGGEGIACKELAEKFARSPAQIAQVLTQLSAQGAIFWSTEKKNVQKKTRIYYKLAGKQLKKESWKQKAAESKEKEPMCGNCQRFSGIHRCILLDRAFAEAPWTLPRELKERVKVDSLARNTPACAYYDPRENGHWKSKTMNDFIQRNRKKGSEEFLCPITRCRKVIDEFSLHLQYITLGATTFYCPHCSSPMVFTYNDSAKRYEVQYWDARFDILQKDYYALTGFSLPTRYKEDTPYGVSIRKANSFHLNLSKGILYVGSEATPKELHHTKDLTFFPLRKLNYIATNDWDDYFYLEGKLHAVIPGTNRKLYETIKLFAPRNKIKSPEPLEKEVGGNEILIATECLNVLCFLKENLAPREVLLRKMVNETDNHRMKNSFLKALFETRTKIKAYTHLSTLPYLQWQQYEGGVGSIMFEPFKLEARQHGFAAPSREQARMVRGEPFLPYGYYHARRPYHSLLNGVNHVIISALKKEVYNEVPFPWEGLRGWCHRKYSRGLLYDKSELAKLVGLLCAHQAIREKVITPEDFVEQRGKRYEPYFCVLPETETYEIIQQIGREALKTKLALPDGQTSSLKSAYGKHLRHLKELLNTLAHHSAYLLAEKETTKGKVLSLWKKLKQTHNKDFLTAKERRQLQLFTKRFFLEEFVYEPFSVVEIN